ncbi:MAG: serine hydrolase [Chloroflexota bacterium]
MSLETSLKALIGDFEAGIAVWHIESGEQVEINGLRPFPMASVFKIPILATAARLGKINLDDRIPLTKEVKSIGSGVLQFFEPGVSPTFRDLLTLMIIISDNTATDMTIALLGGPLVIENTMHELGLNDIYIKMNCKNLINGIFPPEIQNRPAEEIQAWENTHDIVRDGITFALTPENNISSALAMNQLLYMLYQGEVVQGTWKDEVFEILHKQQLNQRLPRFLPSGVSVAHKTGSIGGVANDAGIITIGENNHVILTMFTDRDDSAIWNNPEARYNRVFEVESAMGKVGKLVYEYYRDHSA